MISINIAKRLIARCRKFFSSGHAQSVQAKRNIAASLAIKGVSIAVNLALVPLVLGYLGSVKYGIWVTLGSVIVWINFFDIGLGNGLRNKFTQAVARDEKGLARSYVSTTYFALACISLGLFAVFIAISPKVNWLKAFNAPPELRPELNALILIVFTFFLLQFIFRILGTVLLADQKPALNNSFNVMANILILACVFALSRSSIRASIAHVGFIYSVMPPLVFLIASLYFYRTWYKEYRPSLAAVDKRHFRSLVSLGGQYFIIHVAYVVLFATNNMIITQVLGPEHVTPYNIAFKYFNIVVMVSSIVVQPFWSAFTFAFAKGDIHWIKGTVSKLLWIAGGLTVVAILMLAFSKIAYHIWIGDQVHIPWILSLSMCLYVVIILFGSSFTAFIMGTGKLRLSVSIVILVTLLNIPLSIWLSKFAKLGSAGVVFATCICNLPTVTVIPIQYFKIINKKAHGIWNK